jgi:hypothetical protein
MDALSPSIRALARTLLAEAQTGTNSDVHDVALVSEQLRISLTRFAGAVGFASLLQRAVALASAEVPALRTVSVNKDGRLEGLEQLATHAQRVREEAAVAITAHLLGLLVAFIGESLTQQLLRQLWPQSSLDE